MNYLFIALSEALADSVRETLRSARYDHPASVSLASGYGPCRVCLRTFRVGEEERILFTYNPFLSEGTVPQPGPVFVHRDHCRAHSGPGIPDEIRALPLFVEGYGDGGWTVRRERVSGGDIEAALDRLFAMPGVERAHLRNTEAGCFVATVEKTGLEEFTH